MIILFLASTCLATVLLTLIDGVCGFSFVKQPGRHVMAIFQDDNVNIHQAQIVKEWMGGSMSQDLTFIESLYLDTRSS